MYDKTQSSGLPKPHVAQPTKQAAPKRPSRFMKAVKRANAKVSRSDYEKFYDDGKKPRGIRATKKRAMGMFNEGDFGNRW